MEYEIVLINRAPVLTLWAAVVAERLGYDHEAALSLGKAVAGLNALSKGRNLGIYKPADQGEKPPVQKAKPVGIVPVELLGRLVPAKDFGEGLRAVEKDRPVGPDGVEQYLEEKFGDALGDVIKAMKALAESLPPVSFRSRPSLSTSASGLRSPKGCAAGAPRATWTSPPSVPCPRRLKSRLQGGRSFEVSEVEECVTPQ